MAKIRKLIIIFLITLLSFTSIFPTTPVKVNPVYASPATVHFLYDGDGVRVAKIEEGKTTLYAQGIEKVVETGEVTKYYGLGGKTIAVKTSPPLGGEGNALSFVTSDHLNSTRVLTDPTGVQKAKANYYPYGLSRSQTNVLPSRQYTSQINDEITGLYFYNARYYNPQTANFIQADSVGTNPNKYAYAARNPLSVNDPTGNEGEDAVNPENDCNTNPFSSSCITLSPFNPSYPETPISASTVINPGDCTNPGGCGPDEDIYYAALLLLSPYAVGGANAGITYLAGPITMLYVAGSNLWNQFASIHPRIALGIDVTSALTTGLPPSSFSLGGWESSFSLSGSLQKEINDRDFLKTMFDIRGISATVIPRPNFGGLTVYFPPLKPRIFISKESYTIDTLVHEGFHVLSQASLSRRGTLGTYQEECNVCRQTVDQLIGMGYHPLSNQVQRQLRYWEYNYIQMKERLKPRSLNF